METETRQNTEILTPAPHLNADLYRQHVVTPKYTFFDHITSHSDGSTLLCASNLIGRYWKGRISFFNSPEQCLDVEEVNSTNCEKLELPTSVSDACFLSESTKIVICDDSGVVSVGTKGVWCPAANDSKNGSSWSFANAIFAHVDAVNTVCRFAKSDNFVTGSSDCCIKAWDITTMQPTETIQFAHTDSVSNIASHLTLPNIFLSSSLDGSFSIWDLQSSTKKIKDFKYINSAVRCVCWLNEKDFVIGNDDGTISLYNMSQDDALFTYSVGFPIHRLLFHERSSQLAVCGDSTEIRILRVIDNKLEDIYQKSLHSDYVRGLLWDSTSNNSLYSSGWDGKVTKHTF